MLERRPWLPAESDALVHDVARSAAGLAPADLIVEVERLVARNDEIHRRECFNLNPAGNIMNPRAEALLAHGLSSRPSLGHPGAKHEAGLEAIERIEVIAAELASRTFGARFVELRLQSGSLANLCVFRAIADPGDAIVVPPASIGGHASHHAQGGAGLYGLRVFSAPIDADAHTVDVGRLRDLCRTVRPKLITIGGSLNLFPHPLAGIRAVADDVGARILYDAAHLAGLIAGGAWQRPLSEGADVMTMSTYKSLGGPSGGLILTNDANLAARVEAAAFPGLTANFDVARIAALAVALADLRIHGAAYASAMLTTAKALAEWLAVKGVPIVGKDRGYTASHQFAIDATSLGGGAAAVRRLRSANLLASAIELASAPNAGGIRIGTPELVRIGMRPSDMERLAELLAEALYGRAPLAAVAKETSRFRHLFSGVHFVA